MSTEHGQTESEYRYWAFISYSHADDKWAGWLHKSLETYGVPKVLVGKPSKLGPVPKRAYPVFRDRDELPSSADLGEKLTASLRASRFLIVVCSPAAVKSKWVAEEIKAFKSMGREERVLCLIVDGEPYASDHPEWGLEECFPEPVRYKVDSQGRITGERTEPIAADARKGKDGRDNAKLKLLAGMFGVNFSDLRQRDQERKHRRQQIILVSIGVLFVVFSLLSVNLFVEKQRADNALLEAQEQRQRVELEKVKAEKARDIAREAEKKAVEAKIAAEQAKEQEAVQRKAAEEAKVLAEQKRLEAVAANEKEQEQRRKAEQAQKDAEIAADLARKAEKKAVDALVFAEEQRKLAVEQQKIAEAERRRAFGLLSIGDFNEATKLIEDGNNATALAFLSRALVNNPENTSAQARLLALLEQNSWALPRTAPIQHAAPVNLVAFNPAGGSLLTVAGNTAQLWNADTGKPAGAPMAHRGGIRSAAFSDDGTKVVTASEDGTARIWDAKSGQPVGQPLAHQDWVYTARFSPDGSKVATGSREKKLTLWDAATGKVVGTPLPMDNSVEKVVFSHDGTRLIALVENKARLINVTGNAEIAALEHKGRVESADFSPDGQFIATASLDGTAQLWDATGKAVNAPMAHTDQVYSVEFSPDGTRIVTASKDRSARLWDVATSKQIGDAMQHGLPVNNASFSPNGRWVVTASEDRTARIWDAASGRPLIQPIKLDGVGRMAVFNSTGTRIAVGTAGNTAQVWTALSGRPLSVPVSHEQYVNWVAFSPDGRHFATTSEDRTARVWDTGSGKPVTGPLPHNNRVTYVEFSPDGKAIVTASEDRSARVWDVATGKQVGQSMDHGSWVNMARFSPDGKRIVTAAQDFTARVWDAVTGKPVTPPLKPGGNVRSAMFSPDGRLVLASSTDGNARVWDATTGNPLHGGFVHKQEVRHAVFSRDGKYVATASEDRTARVWETQTGKPVTEPLRHDGPVNWVDFSPADSKGNVLLISASDDRSVRVWDALTGRPKAEPLVHEVQVKTAFFSPDGQLVVTAPRDKAARVYEASGWKQVTQPLQHASLIRAAVFSPDGSLVGTAGEDKVARVWMLSLPGTAPDWMGQLAEAVGGARLGEAGGTELVSQAWERISDIQQKLQAGSKDDAFVRWGRWFLADRDQRSISSYSSVPISEFIRERIDQGGTNALLEALSVQPANALALAKLGLAVGDGASVQSDFYSRLAMTYEPRNSDVLWRRAAVLQKRNAGSDALALMQEAIKLDPRSQVAFGPEGRDIAQRNMSGTGSTGWVPNGWEDANASKTANVTYSKVTDGPPGAGTSLRVAVKSPARIVAELRGPRVVAPAGKKIVIEGFVRSDTLSDLTVIGRQFIEPYEEYGKQFVRTTKEWKPFKITIDPRKDAAAEAVLGVGTDAVVDVAGVKIRVE